LKSIQHKSILNDNNDIKEDKIIHHRNLYGEDVILSPDTPSPTASPTPCVPGYGVICQTPSPSFGGILEAPSPSPTPAPTSQPTPAPTAAPTNRPSLQPTPAPTNRPSNQPTPAPTNKPTQPPTPAPTNKPTYAPTPAPTNKPSKQPTPAPTNKPTGHPTPAPTPAPTNRPTKPPTGVPTLWPTRIPTHVPTKRPTFPPTPVPSPDIILSPPTPQPTAFPISSGCETAIAFDSNTRSQCFSDIIDPHTNAIVAQRWGWANGPYNDDLSYPITLNIYAGAGQCDINKGTLVGHLIINYNELTCQITITYQALAGFVFTEVHLYVGDELMFIECSGNTCQYSTKWGHYPYSKEFTSGQSTVTFNIEERICDDFYVTAHSVACGDNNSVLSGDTGTTTTTRRPTNRPTKKPASGKP
jgi:hypothetical protein